MYLLGMKYLEALPTLAQGKNATIFLPAEAAGVMGAIGGLRELVMRAASSSLHTQSDAPARLGPRSDADSAPKDPRKCRQNRLRLSAPNASHDHTRARTVANTASRS